MPLWRLSASLFVIIAWTGAASAQNAALVEAPLPKACFRIDLKMELSGEIRVQQDGKQVSFKQTAKAHHQYLERVLEAKSDVADKTARIYQTAEATITVDKETSSRKLRGGRSLMIAQGTKTGLLVYCPKGLLTQEELELTEHLDTLQVSGILPGKEVAAGETWKVGNHVAHALCDLDGLIEHNLTGKLDEVKSGLAHISMVGQVKGIQLGAEVKMLIEARGQFDLKEKRLTRLEWKQSDQRDQGPVNPALSTDVTYTLTRTPIAEPNELNDIALVPALAVAADTVSAISHTDPKGRFELQHGREWHLVGQDDKHLVYRLLDRGDFVAQATLTPFKKESSGNMMSLNEFVELMVEAPGWKHEDLIDKTDKVDVGGGIKAYRVAASGELEGVKAVQYFYLLHGPQGHQMIVTFTMAPNQVRNLDARDLALLRGIAFPKKEE
jgi:hypothetical protein